MISEAPRPFLADVARHAGVSPATVSRVLNNTAPVRESVRERVLEAVTVLGYEAPMARSNGAGRRGTIAVLVADILNPFFSEILRGIEDEGAGEDLVLSLYDSAESGQRETHMLRTLAHNAVNGIIVCSARLATPELIALCERRRVPTVVINRFSSGPHTICITIDAENATSRAGRHLLDLGHTRIAYLAGPSDSAPSKDRRRGLETVLGEAGLVLPPEWCPHSFPNADGGFKAMSALLSLPPADRPTAVIAYNDTIALGALHAIRSHRLSVPEDISVVGFDDIAMAAHANPPLTTISQPKHQMGQLAMRLLRQTLDGKGRIDGGYTLLEAPLIVRESTGPFGADKLA